MHIEQHQIKRSKVRQGLRIDKMVTSVRQENLYTIENASADLCFNKIGSASDTLIAQTPEHYRMHILVYQNLRFKSQCTKLMVMVH